MSKAAWTVILQADKSDKRLQNIMKGLKDGMAIMGNSTKRKRDRDIRDFTNYYVFAIGITLASLEILMVLVLKRCRRTPASVKLVSINMLTADIFNHLLSSFLKITELNAGPEYSLFVKIANEFSTGIAWCISLASLAILILDRVITMSYPLHYKSLVTKKRVYVLIFVTDMINVLVYLSAIVWFMIDCHDLSSLVCVENGSKNSLKSFVVRREFTVQTIMLVIYEIANMILCIVLVHKINFRLSESHLQFDGVKENTSATSSPMPQNDELLERHNIKTQLKNEKVLDVQPIHVHVQAAQDREMDQPSSGNNANEKKIPEKNGDTKRHEFPATGAQKKRSVAKVILSVATIQLLLHLPFAVDSVVLIFEDPTKAMHWRQYLDLVCTLLVHLKSLPSIYLYIWKLRECQEIVKKMCCIRGQNRQ